MIITPIKTRIANPPQDDVYDIIEQANLQLQEKDIVVITTKLLAIHQGRCILIDDVPNKDDLIIQEAERFLPRNMVPGGHAIIAIKNQALLGSAGIDESNGNGYYILLPENIPDLLKEIHTFLLKKFKLKELGLITTDSHTVPFHYGTIGVALGSHGFKVLYDYRGTKDLFDRPLKMTQKNIADGLAAAAVIIMGEGSESTPISIIRDIPNIKFIDGSGYDELLIPPDQDLYASMFSNFQK